MKKSFFLILFFLVTANLLFAQVRFGVKLGADRSYVRYGSGSNSGSFLGFSAGFMGEYPASSNLLISTELLFSKQGYAENSTVVDGKIGDFSVRSHYLDIPLLAKLTVYRKLNVQLGTQLGISLGNSARIGNMDIDNLPKPNPFQFGLVGGVGYSLNKHLFFDFRYIHSLTHIYAGVREGFQFRTLQLSIGYRIR